MSVLEIKDTKTKKIQALTDILESIALEEAAISYLLNAECDKLQKTIANQSSTQDDLLNINKSVDELVDTLTNLELILKSKMRLVLKDKCYSEYCDATKICQDIKLSLQATNGIITKISQQSEIYNLDVIDSTQPVNVQIDTIPPMVVSIENLNETGVSVSLLNNVITITKIGATFEGIVTVLARFGECERIITININSQEITCNEVSLIPTANKEAVLIPIGNNHYELELLESKNGTFITIDTSDINFPVTEIEIKKNEVTNATITVEENVIHIKKPKDEESSGLLRVTVYFGIDCKANIRFEVETIDG